MRRAETFEVLRGRLSKPCTAGVGYKLRIQKEHSAYQSEAVLAVVRKTVPQATVEQDKENEAVMALNTMQRDGFSTMFQELEDGSPSLGIRSIGVSVATMKDAYIRIYKEWVGGEEDVPIQDEGKLSVFFGLDVRE
ncbi:hypothetical protein MTO96_001827 [Rhipicephalus appendiculatus]